MNLTHPLQPFLQTPLEGLGLGEGISCIDFPFPSYHDCISALPVRPALSLLTGCASQTLKPPLGFSCWVQL